jgi:hypothetical protein
MDGDEGVLDEQVLGRGDVDEPGGAAEGRVASASHPGSGGRSPQIGCRITQARLGGGGFSTFPGPDGESIGTRRGWEAGKREQEIMKTGRGWLTAACVLLAGTASFGAWVIEGDQVVAASDLQFEGQDIEVRSGTLRVSGDHAFGALRLVGGAQVVIDGTEVEVASVSLQDSAQLTLAGGLRLTVAHGFAIDGVSRVILQGKQTSGLVEGAWRGVGVVVRAETARIGAAAWVSADAAGYPGATWRSQWGIGPGGGQGGGDLGSGGGGGHGAVGGSPLPRPEVAGGAAYGSPFEPEALGSGGGGGQPDRGRGGEGGGALHWVVQGELALDGRISANGGEGSGTYGGGSGGSVWIESGTLSGGGRVEALGGSGGPDGGGGGAGGRVAVWYRTNRFGNASGCSVKGGLRAEDGTLVFVDRSVPGLGLGIHQRFALGEGEGGVWGKIRVHAGGRFLVGPDGRVGVSEDLEIEGDGTVTLGGGGWIGVTNALRLTGSNAVVRVQSKNADAQVDGAWRGAGGTIWAGSVWVAPGARLTADLAGYPGATWRSQRGIGPGGGQGGGDFGSGGGGGHGAAGGSPLPRPEVAGGAAYGSPFEPEALGSGGGGGQPDRGRGGEGGGALHLVVQGELALEGRISANGGEGIGTYGGGSGGSVWVESGTLSGQGMVEALGGSGGPDGGGGGAGGRVAVWYRTNRFGNASGCSVKGGLRAEDGTLVFVDRSVPGLGLGIHQRFALGEGEGGVWGKIRVHAGGRFLVGPDGRVGVSEDLEIEGEGTMTLGGGGWIGVTNALRLTGSNAVVRVQSKNGGGTVDDAWRGVGGTIRAGSVWVAPGARLTADLAGYPGSTWRSQRGFGPGGGQGGGDLGSGGGGGHGAVGGSPLPRPEVAGGAAYGSPFEPEALGSGGGGGYPDRGRGGEGGGAVHLVVESELALDGRISANGGEGIGTYGGGSGGSVWIESGTLSGQGRVEALGGSGGPDGGGGGAGDASRCIFGRTGWRTRPGAA